MDDKIIKIDDQIVYHDPTGKPHNALVTAVWSQLPNGCLNLVYVSSDQNKQDQYGRQIERATSVNHKDYMRVHGSYWRFVDETPNPYVKPESV